MARAKKNTSKNNNNGANLGFEAKLWQAADAMRGSMDAAEYKHVALGLIFLKYISDAFEEQYAIYYTCMKVETEGGANLKKDFLLETDEYIKWLEKFK